MPLKCYVQRVLYSNWLTRVFERLPYDLIEMKTDQVIRLAITRTTRSREKTSTKIIFPWKKIKKKKKTITEPRYDAVGKSRTTRLSRIVSRFLDRTVDTINYHLRFNV